MEYFVTFKNLILNLIFDIESINLISIYNLKYRCYYLVNYFIDWYCFYVIFQHIAVRTKYRCKIEGASNFNFRVTLFYVCHGQMWFSNYQYIIDCGFQWPLNNMIITSFVQKSHLLCYRHTMYFIVFQTFVLPLKIRLNVIYIQMFLKIFQMVCLLVFCSMLFGIWDVF